MSKGDGSKHCSWTVVVWTKQKRRPFLAGKRWCFDGSVLSTPRKPYCNARSRRLKAYHCNSPTTSKSIVMHKNFWYRCFEIVPILVSPAMLHNHFHGTVYNHFSDFIAALYPQSKSISNRKLLNTYKSALLPLLQSFRTFCWRFRFPYSFSPETKTDLIIARGTLLLFMDCT